MARGTIYTRKSADGKNRYAAIIRVNGRPKWKTFERKADAEEYLDNNSRELRDGTYRELKKATFEEFAEHYKTVQLIPEKYKPSTYKGYCSILSRHLLPALKNFPMASITAADINEMVARVLKKDSRNTVRNILNLLRKMFSKAVAEGYVKFSPMQGVERPRISRDQKGRALKPEEITALLDHCDDDGQLMILTALLTGMRRGEQFGLGWEHVDFDKNVIKVRRALYWKFGKSHNKQDGEAGYVFVEPKSKHSIRDIDLSPMLRKELLALYMRSDKTGLVFHTEKGTPINPDNVVSRKFKPAVEAAKIGKVRWHDLRHTFGSIKIAQGENPFYVQKQMGHSSIQITFDIYGHQLEERKPAAAAKTDFFIFGKK
ncbi:MAG: tyrosine-type recombinase/integrase [Acidobacteriota bacterium]|nr:tyrosine-type recombinase/integrase [Acidobacteriota bacterium]